MVVNPNMKVVLVGAGDSVGKDTFCNYLVQHLRVALHQQVKAANFAYNLKMVCHILYQYTGLKRPEYYDEYPHEKDRKLVSGETPREIWVRIAKFLRMADENIFITSTLPNEHLDWFILRDWRFKSEYNLMSKYFKDIHTVEVTRIGKGAFKYELGDFPFDYVVENNGSQRDLADKAAKLVDKILNSFRGGIG